MSTKMYVNDPTTLMDRDRTEICKLVTNDEVELLGEKGSWAKVKVQKNNATGFVLVKKLSDHPVEVKADQVDDFPDEFPGDPAVPAKWNWAWLEGIVRWFLGLPWKKIGYWVLGLIIAAVVVKYVPWKETYTSMGQYSALGLSIFFGTGNALYTLTWIAVTAFAFLGYMTDSLNHDGSKKIVGPLALVLEAILLSWAVASLWVGKTHLMFFVWYALSYVPTYAASYLAESHIAWGYPVTAWIVKFIFGAVTTIVTAANWLDGGVPLWPTLVCIVYLIVTLVSGGIVIDKATKS